MRLLLLNNVRQSNWSVFHVPTCTSVPGVVWADDSTHMIAVHCGAFFCMLHKFQLRKVVLLHKSKTVLLDPLDDMGDDEVSFKNELLETAEYV